MNAALRRVSRLRPFPSTSVFGLMRPNAFREFGVLVPEGHRENSPAFQRWVEAGREVSPGGTTENWVSVPVFCRPSGTLGSPTTRPSVETLGYCRMSLRDRLRPEFPKGIMIKPELRSRTGRGTGARASGPLCGGGTTVVEPSGRSGNFFCPGASGVGVRPKRAGGPRAGRSHRPTFLCFGVRVHSRFYFALSGLVWMGRGSPRALPRAVFLQPFGLGKLDPNSICIRTSSTRTPKQQRPGWWVAQATRLGRAATRRTEREEATNCF